MLSLKVLLLKWGRASMRVRAAQELAMSGDERAVAPLITALKDPSARHAAKVALIRLGQPAIPGLVAALENENWETRFAAEEVLGEIGAAAVEPLAAAIRRGVKGSEEAIACLRDLNAIEPLLRLIDDEDEHVRAGAARALGNARDPRVADALIAALQDPQEHVRTAAAQALAKVRDPRAIEALAAAAASESAHWQPAAKALAVIDDARAKKALFELVGARFSRQERSWVDNPEARASPTGQRMKPVCDICSTRISAACPCVPYEVFQLIVHLGYNPFTSGRASRVSAGIDAARSGDVASAVLTLMNAGPQREGSLYEGWRDMVFKQWTAWALCDGCLEDVRAFLGLQGNNASPLRRERSGTSLRRPDKEGE